MSIAEKLTTIAQNQQKVYDAGQKAMHDLWLNQAITQLNDADKTTIGNYQFFNFTELERVTLPSVTSVGQWGFRKCSSLWMVDIPLLEAVSSYAFRETSVRRFDFSKVTSIGLQGFYGNSELRALILRGDTLPTLENVSAFTGSGVENGTGFIYVKSALLEEGKSATNWSTFGDQFRAIEDHPGLDTATVTITEQPVDSALASNKQAIYTVTAEGSNLSYLWYLRESEDAKWSKASDFSTYRTNEFKIYTTTERDGWQFYCEITDEYGHMVKTNIVTMRCVS